MINWYDNETLAITFSDTPHVCIRYLLPYHTKEEKEDIKKLPFICKTELKVELADKKKNKTYKFTIPKDYCYDGASINRLFWRIIGSNTDNKFLIAALIHDVLCENHEYVDNDRYFSTLVFERLLYTSDVPAFKRWMMKHAVDNYQKFCKW